MNPTTVPRDPAKHVLAPCFSAFERRTDSVPRHDPERVAGRPGLGRGRARPSASPTAPRTLVVQPTYRVAVEVRSRPAPGRRSNWPISPRRLAAPSTRFQPAAALGRPPARVDVAHDAAHLDEAESPARGKAGGRARLITSPEASLAGGRRLRPTRFATARRLGGGPGRARRPLSLQLARHAPCRVCRARPPRALGAAGRGPATH